MAGQCCKILTDVTMYGMSRAEAWPGSGSTETLCTPSCEENNRKKKHRRRKLSERERKKKQRQKVRNKHKDIREKTK
jgi:hypothetical protein